MAKEREELNNFDKDIEDAIEVEGILMGDSHESQDYDIFAAFEEAEASYDDVVEDVPDIVSDRDIGTLDDIMEDARYDDISEAVADVVDRSPVPDKITSLEDALLAADHSGLPPAPVPERSLATRKADKSISSADVKTGEQNAAELSGKSLFGKGVDKYGLPLAEKKVPDPPSEMAAFPGGKKKEPLAIPRIPSLAELVGIDPSKSATYPNNKEKQGDTGPKDFKVNFDFDSAYKDPPENRPLRRRRERRTGLVGGIMYTVFILCTGLVLAAVMWMATVDVLGFSAPDETVDIVVPEGFTMDTITDLLYEAGLVRYKALFSIFAEYSNAEDKISPGSYVLNRNFDYRALVQGMTARAGVRVETTVTIPEGYTLSQIFNLLEAEEVCSAEDLWEAATHHDFNYYFLDKETLGDRLRLEGFLFPDTYNFYKDSTAVRALNRMLREFDNKFVEQYVERADTVGYTIREIIIIASMVEREAGNDEERSRIAAVIYNRLNNPTNFPNLEIDATIHYYRAERDISFAEAMAMENPYNTYKFPGLPPGPIANPGIASIRAALYPDNTNEYFYALNKNGTHNFFRSYSEHNAFVNSDEYGGN